MREEVEQKIDFEKLKEVCQDYNVLALYLYGSQVTGETDKFSDFDLGVLFIKNQTDLVSSADFYMKFKEAISQAISVSEIDLLFLQNASLKVEFKVITTGEVLYSANDQLRLDYEDKAICKGLDFRVEMELYYDELETIIKRGDMSGR